MVSSRGPEVAQPGLFGDPAMEYKVEGKGRCPGDLRTWTRELRLHPYARVPARLSTPLLLYCLSQGFLSFRANQYLHLDPSQDLFEYSVSEGVGKVLKTRITCLPSPPSFIKRASSHDLSS